MKEITDNGNKTFTLLENGISTTIACIFYPKSEQDTVELIPLAGLHEETISARYDNLKINGTIPTSVENAVSLLTTFIGNFKTVSSGGGDGTGATLNLQQVTNNGLNTTNTMSINGIQVATVEDVDNAIPELTLYECTDTDIMKDVQGVYKWSPILQQYILWSKLIDVNVVANSCVVAATQTRLTGSTSSIVPFNSNAVIKGSQFGNSSDGILVNADTIGVSSGTLRLNLSNINSSNPMNVQVDLLKNGVVAAPPQQSTFFIVGTQSIKVPDYNDNVTAGDNFTVQVTTASSNPSGRCTINTTSDFSMASLGGGKTVLPFEMLETPVNTTNKLDTDTVTFGDLKALGMLR